MTKRSFLIFATILVLMVGARFTAPPLLSAVGFSQVFTDRSGRLLRLTLARDEKYRLPSKLSSLPSGAVEMALLHEDQYFYFHPGFNPWSLLRGAMISLRGPQKVGGSTLTMQVARLLYRLETRTFGGKLKQLGLAVWLELRYSKKEILEAYFSLAPYGGNIEGLEAAALVYFGLPAANLDTNQVLSLTLVPQMPSHRNIEVGLDKQDSWVAARRRLAERWAARHPLLAVPKVVPLVASRNLPFLAPHLVDLLSDRFSNLSHIQTTLDLGLQKKTETLMTKYFETREQLGVRNGAALLVDLDTLEVLAFVGSGHYQNVEIHGQVNGVTARRSPGSALKPFVFALGIEAGLIHPWSGLRDIPIGIGGFDPENFDHSFRGPIPAQEALVQSRNIPAIELAMKLPDPGFYGFLKALRVPLNPDPRHYGFGLPIGGAEVSLEEMVTYYAALARRSTATNLKYFSTQKILDITPDWGISPEAAFITLEMLTHNQRQDIERFENFRAENFPVAWKTGTSNGFKDAWTLGVFDHYALGVWIGNFSGEPNPNFLGRDIAAPLFFQIAESIRGPGSSTPIWLWPKGLNIQKEKVCRLSGHRPGKACHSLVESWVIPGKSFLPTCQLHRSIWISKKSGRRLCPGTEPEADSRLKDFEFWPSDVLKTYANLGVRLQAPPIYEDACRDQVLEESSSGPDIVSPQRGLVYSFSLLKPESWSVPFVAASAADARRISWFVGKSFVGQSEPSKAFVWKGTPGKYHVTAIDDLGRSRTIDLVVTVQR